MEDLEEFDTLAFEKKLMQLKDTQESIQSLSTWCLKQRDYHKKIVSSWLNVLKRVKVEQRLTLFYLANDVIQYSKRKNFEFVESWGLNLQKATPLVRDEKVRPKILRIFKIWEQRSVYDDEFLSDLTGLLSAGAVKKTDDDPLDFQPQQLVNKIKQCTVLEQDTDARLKDIHDNPLDMSDTEALCAELKDRSLKDDVERELNEGIQCVEKYTQALQREIVARETLLALLSGANQYYSTQRGEVKVVAYAYKNFGARVRALKRKLDELVPRLPSPPPAPSPPRRDEDVPSPGPDEDIDLPNNNDENDVSYDIDKTFNTSLSVDGSMYSLGLSSFMGSDNATNMFQDAGQNESNNKIEVLNSRPNEKQDFDINSFIKNLIPNNNSSSSIKDNDPVLPPSFSQKSQGDLPGLDLLSESSNPPPPTSFYGTGMDTHNDDPDVLFRSETNSPWNSTTPINTSWNAPPPLMVPAPSTPLPSLASAGAVPPGPSAASVPPVASDAVPPVRVQYSSPPASPPRVPAAFTLPVPTFPQEVPLADVDHRGVLPPPPPPPVLPLLGQMEDVDHRLLPPPPPTTTAPPRQTSSNKDVDHRNLISLTHQPPPRPVPRPAPDQDYRVPPIQPTDIVESVDMDLSEDEDQHTNALADRRYSKNNNNKVLVGGDNGKTNHTEEHNPNLLRINSLPSTDDRYQEKISTSITAPALSNITNPFDMQNFMEAPPKFNEMAAKFTQQPPHFNNMPLQFNDKTPRFSEPPKFESMPPFNEPHPTFNELPPQQFNDMPPKYNERPSQYGHEMQQFKEMPPKFNEAPTFRSNFRDPRSMRENEEDDFDIDIRSRQIGDYQENADWSAPRFRPRFHNPNMRLNGPRHFAQRPWMPPRPHRPPFW